MSGKTTKYTSEFKQTIVNLYRSGKTCAQINQEYGISHSALANGIKQYSKVQIDENTVLTAKQIKELQKRNAQLEEENLILKKPLRYSRHTHTKIEGSRTVVKRTQNNYLMQSTKGQPKHLLQIS